MDIRQLNNKRETAILAQNAGKDQDKSEIDMNNSNQSYQNVAIYNLIKFKSLYNELAGQFNQIAKVQLPKQISPYFKIYSYKPALYIGLATLAHMYMKKLSFAWVFVHGSAYLLINQWDINTSMQKINKQKWQQYQKAIQNYQIALNMNNIKTWNYVRDLVSQKIKIQDYSRLLNRMPH